MDNSITVKAFFFDLFGTLLVFRDFDCAQKLWIAAFNDLVGRPNGLSFDDICAACGEILNSSSKKDVEAGLTTYETRIRDSLEKLHISLPRNALARIADETISVWQDYIRLAEDAVHVLTELKKRSMIGLITNFDHSPHVRRVVSDLKLDRIFDLILISDEVGCAKPDPEIFRLALRKMRILARYAVHVGDSIRDDIMGALSVGIRPILIDRNVKSHENYDREESISSAGFPTIHSLSELLG
jgi:putative hydrolase of the HAD superfamily